MVLIRFYYFRNTSFQKNKPFKSKESKIGKNNKIEAGKFKHRKLKFRSFSISFKNFLTKKWPDIYIYTCHILLYDIIIAYCQQNRYVRFDKFTDLFTLTLSWRRPFKNSDIPLWPLTKHKKSNLANIYLFKVSNWNTRKRCEICSC